MNRRLSPATGCWHGFGSPKAIVAIATISGIWTLDFGRYAHTKGLKRLGMASLPPQINLPLRKRWVRLKLLVMLGLPSARRRGVEGGCGAFVTHFAHWVAYPFSGCGAMTLTMPQVVSGCSESCEEYGEEILPHTE